VNQAKITLELDADHFPWVLQQYGPEGAKKTAISMCQTQYPGEALTAERLYSCLANLESDLEGMFESGIDDPQ
jgi:hypothetical protein